MSPYHMFFWLIRVLDDMRLWVILNFVPCIAIPVMLFLFPPKYTHSRFWFIATGSCNQSTALNLLALSEDFYLIDILVQDFTFWQDLKALLTGKFTV